jgi:hypothetical protein
MYCVDLDMYCYILVYRSMYCVDLDMYCYILVCTWLRASIRPSRPPRKAPVSGSQPVSDPSIEVVEMLIQCMEWNMATRQSSIAESERPQLQQKQVDLIDLLQKNLPDKTGEIREIVLGATHITPLFMLQRYFHICTDLFLVKTSTYTEHTSTYPMSMFCQHAHIKNTKTGSNLTNNKDVFILRFHARAGYPQT